MDSDSQQVDKWRESRKEAHGPMLQGHGSSNSLGKDNVVPGKRGLAYDDRSRQCSRRAHCGPGTALALCLYQLSFTITSEDRCLYKRLKVGAAVRAQDSWLAPMPHS